MSSPEEEVHRPSQSLTEEGLLDQSGRSTTSLVAQAEAQRSALDDAKSPVSELTAEPPRRASNYTPDVQKMCSGKRWSDSASPSTRNLGYLPNISSPLNPNISPPSSFKSRNSNEDKLVDPRAMPSTRPSTRPSARRGPRDVEASAARRVRGIPLSQRSMTPMLQAPSTSQVNLQDPSTSRVGTPMSVRDLGSDYTRYYNPFSDSQRSSFIGEASSGIATPIPNMQSTSRLSLINQNPFASRSDRSTRTSLDMDEGTRERQGLLRPMAAGAAFSPFLDDRLSSSPYLPTGQTYSFPMFMDEKEDDDDMHMPMADDNVRFKPNMRDYFTRDHICSTVGLVMMLLGILFIFIIFPVLVVTDAISLTYAYDTPMSEFPQREKPEPWATVNNRKYPLLKNVRSTLIDNDTPSSAMTRRSYDGSTLNLVFSDEFNDQNRTFYDGDDPYWFAGDFWYGATQDLDWYDPDAVTTWNGALELKLDAFDNHGLKFRSGMLNSWNKLCFKGGVFEVSISLPGPAGKMGLWPGAWAMGNLGRPGHLSTTDGMWPYTYNDCDAGITPNQSDPSGISRLPGQRLNSCTCPNEDHPTPGTGRGAPEIDILEASASYQVEGLGVMTQSFQVAPFDPWYEPDYEFMSFPQPNISFVNTYTGGPFQQAVSGTTTLNNAWYDGISYQKYAYEYRPGANDKGWIAWYVADNVMFTMDGRAIRKNGNVGDRLVSEEPMSMILNLGFSNSWVSIDWASLRFPTIMRVDYVRIYQPQGEEMITCDPPGYETTQYIDDHIKAYTNPNFTRWDQTGYPWPKHKLNTQC